MNSMTSSLCAPDLESIALGFPLSCYANVDYKPRHQILRKYQYNVLHFRLTKRIPPFWISIVVSKDERFPCPRGRSCQSPHPRDNKEARAIFECDSILHLNCWNLMILKPQMLLVTMSHLSQRLARHLCTWVGSCTLVGLLVHGGGKYFSNCQYLKTFEGLVHHLGQRTILVSAEITWRDHNPDLGKAITFWNHGAKWKRSRFVCATRVYNTEKESHAWDKRGKIHLHVSRRLFVLFIYFRHWFNFL